MLDMLVPVGHDTMISPEQENVLRDCCKDEESYRKVVAMMKQAVIEAHVDHDETGQLYANSQLIELIGKKFRIPLHTIAMSAEMLTRYNDKLTTLRREMHFDRIRRQVYFLRDMVQNIAIINSLDTEPLFHPTPFFELCARLEADIHMSASYSSNVIFRYNANETRSLHVDYELVKQVAENLVANGLKFSEADSLVEVTLRCSENTWFFEVRDYGIGVPRADQPHIFDQFYRGENVGLRTGMGLGLSNARSLVNGMGGRLIVESEGRDKGTYICAELPIDIDEDYLD